MHECELNSLHDADCGSQWRFPRLRACAPPSISESVDVWRIDGQLTQKLYRNGCNTGLKLHSPYETNLLKGESHRLTASSFDRGV